MRKTILKYGLLATLWFVYTLPAMAGPGDPPADDSQEQEAAPIDNWVTLLIIAAIAIGIYFIVRYRKKQLI